MNFYSRIRDLREDEDLTQEQLVKKLNMHKTTYTNYEQGKHSIPLDFAAQLSVFYDVSLDYTLFVDNKKIIWYNLFAKFVLEERYEKNITDKI